MKDPAAQKEDSKSKISSWIMFLAGLMIYVFFVSGCCHLTNIEWITNTFFQAIPLILIAALISGIIDRLNKKKTITFKTFSITYLVASIASAFFTK